MARIITLKWGNKYSSEYVNILHRRFQTYLSNCDFVCYTDNPNGLHESIEWLPLPTDTGLYGWWFKLWILAQDHPGTNIFFDLDVLIRTRCERFLAQDSRLWIIKNGRRTNSSVMSWQNSVPQPFALFNERSEYHLAQRPPYGDQELIEECIAQGTVEPAYYEDGLIDYLRVKREGGGVRRNNSAPVVICKGPRNPHQHSYHPLVKELWR